MQPKKAKIKFAATLKRHHSFDEFVPIHTLGPIGRVFGREGNGREGIGGKYIE